MPDEKQSNEERTPTPIRGGSRRGKEKGEGEGRRGKLREAKKADGEYWEEIEMFPVEDPPWET